MKEEEEERNITFLRHLPIPKDLKEEMPLTAMLQVIKASNDKEIRSIMNGKSKKKLLVIGPCSADRKDAVLEYCSRLATLQKDVRDEVVIVPRVYTQKPRTNGSGYKGMLHSPVPGKEEDLYAGIKAVRDIHLSVLRETGLSTADEMLYPEEYRFISDLISYVAIGARSSENQNHRLVASGLDVPVGVKNPTSGNMSVLMNSIKAAQSPHKFIYRNWEVESKGNPLAHALLRGRQTETGRYFTNYHYENLIDCYKRYVTLGLANPSVVIDTNHANSGKDYTQEPRVVKEVLFNMRQDPTLMSFVKGFLVESYLVDGNQPEDGQTYGKSITDACIGWETTEALVTYVANELAKA